MAEHNDTRISMSATQSHGPIRRSNEAVQRFAQHVTADHITTARPQVGPRCAPPVIDTPARKISYIEADGTHTHTHTLLRARAAGPAGDVAYDSRCIKSALPTKMRIARRQIAEGSTGKGYGISRDRLETIQ
jgi:hypothetical protein